MSPPPAPHQDLQKLRPDKAGILARPTTPNAPAAPDPWWADSVTDFSISLLMTDCDAKPWDVPRHDDDDSYPLLCPTQLAGKQRRKAPWKRTYQAEYNRHGRHPFRERTMSRKLQEIWAAQSNMDKEAHREWTDPWADTCSDRTLKAEELTCDADPGSTSRSRTVAVDLSIYFTAAFPLLYPRPVSTRVDLTDRYGWHYSKSREGHPALHSINSFTNHLGLLAQERLVAGRAADTASQTTEPFTGRPTIRDIIFALAELSWEGQDLAPGLRAGTDILAVRSYRASHLASLWTSLCDLPPEEPERFIARLHRKARRLDRRPLAAFRRHHQGQARAHLPTPPFMCSTVQPAAP